MLREKYRNVFNVFPSPLNGERARVRGENTPRALGVYLGSALTAAAL
jgi:hypothetical protein